MEQHHGGESLPPDPEQGERLRINSVILPAADQEPVRQHELGVSSINEYQQLVGGLVQPLRLERPAMTLYCHEEGKLLDLPLNHRATLLLWAHNPAFRYRDLVVGDAFLVGQPDEHGLDTDVPDELVKVLFETQSVRVDIQLEGEAAPQPGQVRFDRWTEAYAYALSVTHGWSRVSGFRVVPDA